MGLINVGGLDAMTFKSGNEGFKFYLFAADIEEFLKANPDERYISGLAVRNVRDKGPEFNVSIFDNKDDQRGGRDRGDGHGGQGRRDSSPPPKQEKVNWVGRGGEAQRPQESEKLATPEGNDPYGESDMALKASSPAPSGNRRSGNGGRGRK